MEKISGVKLLFDSNTDHTLEYVEITWGGKTQNPPEEDGMIRKTRDGALSMANVRIEHSQSSGIEIRDGGVYLRDSLIANNPGLGVWLCCGAGASLRNSQIHNNLVGGILNYWPNENCIDAVGNYWGDAGGPEDGDGSPDACGNGGTNPGFGDLVSPGVIYRPWLSSAAGMVSNRSAISVDPQFVIADGVENAEITVTLRDLSGIPLVGKEVELQSTVGTVTQPLGVSDSNGQVRAYISSGVSGFATVTATNLTDNDQVAGIGGVSFWQGPGDTGGLVDPNGTPYAKPELLIDRPPFIVGFPMEFSLPMQNTQPNPLDVEVVYGVTNLNIGVRFTPVFTTQRTLAPGERWNAPGVYVPGSTGHQCVQAALTFDDGSISTSKIGGALFQKNTNKNSCDDLDVKNLVPRGFGLKGVQKHTARSTKEATKANKCITDQVTFGAVPNLASLANPAGDFDQVFVPPVLTPPQVTPGGEITSDLATAMNELANIGARISALITANGVTRQRLQWAGQAGDAAAVNLQYDTFRTYSLWQGQKLLELATAIDAYLDELSHAGIQDVLMTVDGQAAYLEMLKTTGYEQDTIDYLLTSGWGMDEVNNRLAQEIAEYEGSDFASIAFTDAMRATRDKAIAEGNDLVSRYGDAVAGVASSGEVHSLDPMSWEFVVGHEHAATKTVELRVKPLGLPVNWSYELSERVLELDPGETRKVVFSLFPGQEDLADTTINIAVEGYISDELIGGISFEYYVPRLFTSMTCSPGDVTISGPVTYLGGQLSREEAGGKISTQGDVVLESGTTLTYVATGSIKLAPGFKAQAGSTFNAKTEPVTCVAGP